MSAADLADRLLRSVPALLDRSAIHSDYVIAGFEPCFSRRATGLNGINDYMFIGGFDSHPHLRQNCCPVWEPDSNFLTCASDCF